MKNLEILSHYVAGTRPFLTVQGGVKAQPKEQRKVGDTWVDAWGYTITQKNGYTVKSSRVGNLVKEAIGEKVCKDCGSVLKWSNQRLDEKVFSKTERCLDCLIKFETQLRIEGKFKEYENKKVLLNQRAHFSDLRAQLIEAVEYLKTDKELTFINDTGTTETWSNIARKKTLADANRDLKKANKLIADIDVLLANLTHVII